MSYLPTPFFPRFTNTGFGFPTTSHDFGFPAALSQDFAPLLRLLEDMTSAAVPAPPTAVRTVTYQPRFDVRELDNAYELRGELPGVEQNDLSVEFSDAQTLVIRGRAVRESTNNSQPEVQQPQQQQETVNTTPASLDTSEATPAADNSDAMSTHSISSYQRPTVEDAIEDTDDVASSTPGAATPVSSVAGESANTNTVAGSAAEAPAPTTKEPQQQQASSSHYWASERTVGEFQRTFTFPGRVDHDGVRASLKNGVLSIVVPKATRPAVRRIQIQ